MNLANKLTILRIILVPIMVAFAYIPFEGQFLGISTNMLLINLVFIIASITDKLDGNIARSRNQITAFGKFLDPLADKILVISAMIILVEKNLLPAWIPIIAIIREFAVSGYRLIAVQKDGKVIAANIWGKIKTVTQMVAIIAAFININNTNIFGEFFKGSLTGFALFVNIVTTIAFIISTIATVFSGYEYLKNSKDLLKDC